MTCTNLSFKQARMLTLFSKRKVVDPISWLVFFILAIVFSAWYLLFEKTIPGITNMEIVEIVLMSSLSYTFFMMVPVYVNLNILKEHILDWRNDELKKPIRIFVYVPYVIGVLLNALFFAWILKRYSNYSISFLQSQLPLLLNALIIFGVQLISTGLMFKREFIFQARKLVRQRRRFARVGYVLTKKTEMESTGISSTNEMVCIKNKAGTNRIDFPAKQLLYIEAFANGSTLYFKSDDGIQEAKSSDNLTTILANGLLPENLAVRVQKSYIVAIHQVLGRNENNLLLKAEGGKREKVNKLGFKMMVIKPIEIPIGKTYQDQIDLDKWARMNNRSEE